VAAVFQLYAMVLVREDLALGTSRSMDGLGTFTGVTRKEITWDFHQQHWRNSVFQTTVSQANGTWISLILVSFLLAVLVQSLASTTVGVMEAMMDMTSE